MKINQTAKSALIGVAALATGIASYLTGRIAIRRMRKERLDESAMPSAEIPPTTQAIPIIPSNISDKELDELAEGELDEMLERGDVTVR